MKYFRLNARLATGLPACLCLVLLACQTPHAQDLLWQPTGERLTVNAPNSSLEVNRVVSPSHPWLSFHHFGKVPRLRLYDFYARRWSDSLPLKLFEGMQFIRAVYHHSPDSVFAQFNSVYRPGRVVDSTVVRFDRRGQLADHYVPANLPVPTLERPFSKLEGPMTLTTATHQAFHYANGRLFFNPQFWGCYPCKPNCSTRDQPLAGFIDLKTRAGHLLPAFYPDYVYEHHCWPFVHRHPYLVSNHRGELVVGFGMCPRYQVFDPATQRKLREIDVPWSRFVDTIRGIPYGKDGKPVHDEQFDPVEGEYVYFQFDPYRYRYLRWIRLPKHGRRPMIELNRDRFALAVYDSSFKLLGEGLLPEDLQPNEMTSRWLKWFITPEGYWFQNVQASDSTHQVFDRFDLQFAPLGSAPAKAKRRSAVAKNRFDESWTEYLREVQQVAQPDGAWLVVQSIRGCPSCRQTVLHQYGLLRDSLPQLQLNLLVIGPQYADLKLDSLSRGHRYHTEQQFRHHHYVRETGNPRLLIFRRGRLERNYELNPAEVLLVPILLGDYLKGRKLPRPEEL